MLYIVSTPIGNLKDITLRALETLKNVDLIACEDTRHTKILLDHYQIHKPLTSYHSYNKNTKADYILRLLKENKKIALISDAGTPALSDPGNSLINYCIKDKIPFTVIPGPTALISSLIISGLRTDKFIFMGFLPIKSGPRKKIIKTLIKEPRTIIFYESCHRLIKFLEELKEILPERKVVLVKELTKKFEEIFRGIAEEHLLYFQQNKPRGEFVVLVAGNKEKNQ